jgi:hypothetical protein
MKPEIVGAIIGGWYHEADHRLTIQSVVGHLDRALSMAAGEAREPRRPPPVDTHYLPPSSKKISAQSSPKSQGSFVFHACTGLSRIRAAAI